MFYASWVKQTWVKQTWTIQVWPGTIPFTVSRGPNPGARSLYYACGVNGFNIPVKRIGYFVLQLPSGFRNPVEDRFDFMPVSKTQPGGGQVRFKAGEKAPGGLLLPREAPALFFM